MRGNSLPLRAGKAAASHASRTHGRLLRGKGLEVLETREPGGTPKAKPCAICWCRAIPTVGRRCLDYLITAARVEHVNRLIEPALTEGKWVICDRFADSTLAYQGIAGELGLELVEQLQKLAVGATAPDVIFCLMCAPRPVCNALKKEAVQRVLKKGAAFHQTLRDGFLALANENPQRIVLIDGEDTFDNVWGQIEAELGRRFKL